MPLILAIDPDKRQSTQLASLVKTELQAELVQRGTVAEAVDALKGRVPDLVLTSSLDLAARRCGARRRTCASSGPPGPTCRRSPFRCSGSSAPQRAKGVLAALRREKPQPAMTDGCAPDVFAEQIRQYLATAEEQKVAAATMAQVHATAPASPAPIETDAYLYEAGRQPGLEASMEPALVEAAGISVAPPAAIAEPFAEFEEPVPSHEAPRQAFEAWPAPEAPAIASETYIRRPSTTPPWSNRVPSWSRFRRACPAAGAGAEVVAVAEPPAFDDIAVAAAVEVEPDVLVADEPAGLPLSQLLQFVSDSQPRAARTSAPPVAPLEPVAAVPAGPVAPVEELWSGEPVIAADEPWPAEPVALIDPLAARAADPAIVEPSHSAELVTAAARTDDFGELLLDPVAAQALDELSRLAPAASLADGIPAEAPVPVVEMKSFESLDSIANQLAAGPGPKDDNLNDLASLFAATPAPRRPEPLGATFEAPRPAAETPGFESLFATPAPAASAAPIAVPGIDPSLFAGPSAHAVTADPPAHAPLAEPVSVESLFVPRAAEYAEIAAAPVTFGSPTRFSQEPASPSPSRSPTRFSRLPSPSRSPTRFSSNPHSPRRRFQSRRFRSRSPNPNRWRRYRCTTSLCALKRYSQTPPCRKPCWRSSSCRNPSRPSSRLRVPRPSCSSRSRRSLTPEPAVAVQTEANAVAWEFDEEIALDVDGVRRAGRGTGGGSRGWPSDTRFSFTFVDELRRRVERFRGAGRGHGGGGLHGFHARRQHGVGSPPRRNPAANPAEAAARGPDPRRRSAVDDRRRRAEGQPRLDGRRGVRARCPPRRPQARQAEEGTRRRPRQPRPPQSRP